MAGPRCLLQRIVVLQFFQKPVQFLLAGTPLGTSEFHFAYSPVCFYGTCCETIDFDALDIFACGKGMQMTEKDLFQLSIVHQFLRQNISFCVSVVVRQ